MRSRRLYERLTESGEVMVQVAAIHLMLERLKPTRLPSHTPSKHAGSEDHPTCRTTRPSEVPTTSADSPPKAMHLTWASKEISRSRWYKNRFPLIVISIGHTNILP